MSYLYAVGRVRPWDSIVLSVSGTPETSPLIPSGGCFENTVGFLVVYTSLEAAQAVAADGDVILTFERREQQQEATR